jgi:hypothetical protein
MAKVKKERPKNYEPKVKTDKSFSDLINIAVKGKLVQANTKPVKRG